MPHGTQSVEKKKTKSPPKSKPAPKKVPTDPSLATEEEKELCLKLHAEAKKHLGTKEIKGKKHNPKILRWLQAINKAFKADEIPWCAVFMGAVLVACGYHNTRSAMARSYLKYGRRISKPVKGCIVVFSRPPNPRSGHVGVWDSQTNSKTNCLGGNQSDTVSIAPYPTSRVLGYFVPTKNERIAA